MFLANGKFVVLVNFLVVLVALQVPFSNSDLDLIFVETIHTVGGSDDVSWGQKTSGTFVVIVSVQNGHLPRVLSKCDAFFVITVLTMNYRQNSAST